MASPARGSTGTSGPRGPWRAVVFDWGGTLAGYLDRHAEALASSAAAALPAAHRERFVLALRDTLAEFWAAAAEDNRPGQLADLVRIAGRRSGAPFGTAEVAGCVRGYLAAFRARAAADPHARFVLRALRAAGLRTAILSNSVLPPSVHRAVNRRLRLADYLNIELYSSELDYQKPDPRPFLEVLRRLDIADPAQAVMVGDRLREDIHGARAVGMLAVWKVNPELAQSPEEGLAAPDLTVGSLEELLPALGVQPAGGQ